MQVPCLNFKKNVLLMFLYMQVPCLNFKKNVLFSVHESPMSQLQKECTVFCTCKSHVSTSKRMYCFRCMQVPCLNFKKNVPLSETTVRMRHSCYLLPQEKLALPDISYYLSQGRYLTHICKVSKSYSDWADWPQNTQLCGLCCLEETTTKLLNCDVFPSYHCSDDAIPTSNRARSLLYNYQNVDDYSNLPN